MLNVGQFVLLQSLIINCHLARETQYQPTQDELGALRWFLYLSDQGEEERLGLLRHATRWGLRPDELLELRRLADHWLY